MQSMENKLIASLPHKNRVHLLSLCEIVPLALTQVLCESGAAAKYVYFPRESFISLVAALDGTPAIEVGMVGHEGMLGIQLALGISIAPWQGLVQGAGEALRIKVSAFRAELLQSEALRQVLHRYIYVQMSQLSITATCLRFHLIGPRLARWLLMTQDRANTDTFKVTHEFLGYMLGVRRVGITNAASALQQEGLITYHRGHLTVLNRAGLEAAACSCYAADLRVYAAQFKT
jgi:CRP-like cAMP-binding protein